MPTDSQTDRIHQLEERIRALEGPLAANDTLASIVSTEAQLLLQAKLGHGTPPHYQGNPGDDPLAWLQSMEMFCELRSIPRTHWVAFVSESLDGLAATWFRRTVADEVQSHPNLALAQLPIMAWPTFTQSITTHFLNKDLGLTLRSQLSQLR
ncbi:hypothetical protein SYNPS1DRAFT_31574 [Syncephalis pseudoplumigaleata]|uniref:Retrotransposon gag domain-containing protein n=1 Tax=Syncephalis pseudoplumigaleata TaxID=1712513 RepID=A0A4P9YUA8_9FUNG|nr:hypothetical protein SYNPS1DRAFT_31574 [Syncephalis pseudoplumigaleata]|eukprot:RKP22781.1 hypothetical protein SYNPS1DRAFT_31574 [Syncephalis pseudoplumigaleata]